MPSAQHFKRPNNVQKATGIKGRGRYRHQASSDLCHICVVPSSLALKPDMEVACSTVGCLEFKWGVWQSQQSPGQGK